MNIYNSTVLITGAGSGIGKDLAIHFAKCDAKVILCGRHIESLKQTFEIIKCEEKFAEIRVLDISNIKSIESLKDLNVDILINNAGIGIAKPLPETTEDDWDNVINTNLKGTFLMCKTLIPNMNPKGIVFNVSSILGLYGSPNYSVYCSSKFGIIGLTKSLALEYTNMKFYSICPSSTYTEMHRFLVGEEDAKLAQPVKKVVETVINLAINEDKKSGSSIIIEKPKVLFYLDLLKRKVFKQ